MQRWCYLLVWCKNIWVDDSDVIYLVQVAYQEVRHNNLAVDNIAVGEKHTAVPFFVRLTKLVINVTDTIDMYHPDKIVLDVIFMVVVDLK